MAWLKSALKDVLQPERFFRPGLAKECLGFEPSPTADIDLMSGWTDKQACLRLSLWLLRVLSNEGWHLPFTTRGKRN